MNKQWTHPTTGKVFSVDADLDDSTLLRLNLLKNFHLDSICFGHEDGSIFSRKAFPYILLSMHPETLEGHISTENVAALIQQHFGTFETYTFQQTPEAVLRLEGPPASEDPNRANARLWFTTVTTLVTAVDATLTSARK